MKGVVLLTRSEYDKIIEDIVAAEHDRVCESLNAVFAREGHGQEAIIHMIAQLAEDQPATIARIVTSILLKTGILPAND